MNPMTRDPNRHTPRKVIANQVRSEGLVSLDEACFLFPVNNRRGHVSASTLMRWIVSGKKGVRLEGARKNGRWHTSLAAVSRFRERAGV
jgi:hypothetical protein